MNWTPAAVVISLLLVGYAIWFGIVARRRLAAPELRSLPFTSRLRRLGLGVLLLPLATALAGHWDVTGALVPLLVAPGVALAFWTFAPRYVSSKVVPLMLVADGLYGFIRLRDYLRAYGSLRHLASAVPAVRGLGPARGRTVVDLARYRSELGRRQAGPAGKGSAARPARPTKVGPPATCSAGSGRRNARPKVLARHRVVGSRPDAGGRRRRGLPRDPGTQDRRQPGPSRTDPVRPLRHRSWRVLAELTSRCRRPDFETVRYGLFFVDNRGPAIGAGLEGLALTGLGLWLVPRAIDDRTRALFRSASDADLARRVTRLTRTRADAVDSATAQLRRLERDLHDGAQARLVALGMSLRAAERLIPTSPQAAIELVAEARENSVKVLDELRHLVRGICPPVLADRGLADAVQRAGSRYPAAHGRRSRPAWPTRPGRGDRLLLRRRRSADQRGQALRRPARADQDRARRRLAADQRDR